MQKSTRRISIGIVVVGVVLLALPALADDIPLRNWSAPPTWTPPSSPAGAGGVKSAYALTQTYPVPLIPVAPCRVMDTRGNGQTGNFGTPQLGTNVTRTIYIPTHPTCTGIPATVAAYSLNVAVTNTGSGAYGYLQLWPTGQAQPTSANLNYPGANATLSNAVLVQAGTSGGINIFSGNASADVIIDINGYYAWNIVNSGHGFPIITNNSNHYAILGENDASTGAIGVYGYASNGADAIGVRGDSGAGIGVSGTSNSNVGTKGKSTDYNGVWAESTNWDGLYAYGGRYGAYIDGGGNGIVAHSAATSGMWFGLYATTQATGAGTSAVAGVGTGGQPAIWNGNLSYPSGVTGMTKNGYGVVGVSNPSGYAGNFISQDSSTGALQTQAYLGYSALTAGWFYGAVNISNGSAGAPGNLSVAGTVSKGGGSFKIDHPLDPENKYLYHSFVESPDMMNVYNGVVELGSDGSAVVKLPAYFQALNRDFRYQLTAVGMPQPKLHVAAKVGNNEFLIGGGEPYAEVSWQVTGIRKDPFANKYRIITEVEKEAEAKGHYLHPDVYNKAGEAGTMEIVAAAEKTREAAKASRNPEK